MHTAPRFPPLQLALPDWVAGLVPAPEAPLGDDAAMALAVTLARANIAHDGGPFGAVVVDLTSRRLLAPGVNLVVAGRWSGAHAEMVACAVAQQACGTHDLGTVSTRGCALFTSVEPCAMCLGAVPWAGLRQVVYAATEHDARAAGFDEGAKPAQWPERLAERGIAVHHAAAHADAAAQVLRDYAAGGGPIYNAASSATH